MNLTRSIRIFNRHSKKIMWTSRSKLWKCTFKHSLIVLQRINLRTEKIHKKHKLRQCHATADLQDKRYLYTSTSRFYIRYIQRWVEVYFKNFWKINQGIKIQNWHNIWTFGDTFFKNDGWCSFKPAKDQKWVQRHLCASSFLPVLIHW